ncbi:MAG: hypothetical protein LUC97_09455 [Clostridiales bacterium]|nr:hypothetical protein [Clostridiales bacterium]
MEDNERTENKFSKEALIKSRLFKDRRDLVSAVLEDGKEYTKTEAEELIGGYLNKEVR